MFLYFWEKFKKMDKNVLVLIDVQNDFITGSLKNDDALKAIPNIVEKVKNFDGDYIVCTRDSHHDDYLLTTEGKNLPFIHCIQGTYGWEIQEDVQNALNNKRIPVLYFDKNAFGSLLLGRYIEILKNGEPQDVEINVEMCGFVSSICVISNALLIKAFVPDKCNITVDSSCIAGLYKENNDSAIEVMRSCQINVI